MYQQGSVERDYAGKCLKATCFICEERASIFGETVKLAQLRSYVLLNIDTSLTGA